jgi:H+/gluconate symporter-like permease
MMKLFAEADIPRSLSTAPLLTGYATFTLAAMPGTPQLTNVIPATALGTSLTAAPIVGIIGAIMMFVMCYAYCIWQEKKARLAGEHFEYAPHMDQISFNIDKSKLPSAMSSFFPMVILVIIIIFGKFWIPDPTLLLVIAIIIATIIVAGMQWNRLGDKKKLINVSTAGVLSILAGPSAVVAFGSLVANSPSFQLIKEYVLSMNFNPYVTSVFSVSIIAGITGSSSGGVRIAMDALADTFKALPNVDLAILHRLSAIAAGTLDSLPHSSSLFLVFPLLGLTHKETYIHVFMMSVVVPLVTVAILTAGVIFLGY